MALFKKKQPPVVQPEPEPTIESEDIVQEEPVEEQPLVAVPSLLAQKKTSLLGVQTRPQVQAQPVPIQVRPAIQPQVEEESNITEESLIRTFEMIESRLIAMEARLTQTEARLFRRGL